jgi:Domain of unknown function (DUF4440)
MDTQESLIEADRRRRDAMINAQTHLLSGLFDDDLRWIHASGVTDSKWTLLTSIDSGRLDYRSIEPSNERVRLYENLGLITGSIALDVAIDQVARSVRNLFTSVWWHAPGGWRLVNWQTSRCPGADRPTEGTPCTSI